MRILQRVVGPSSLEDCRHIALATIHKVDVLASWNFLHIVNLDKINSFNSVNLKLGYAMLEIRSPKDLIRYENDLKGRKDFRCCQNDARNKNKDR